MYGIYVRMRFKAVHSENKTKYCVAEIPHCGKQGLFYITNECESMLCFAYGLETPLGRTEKPSTYANHCFDETWTPFD